MTAVFGSMLLVGALMAGAAGAQSSPDTNKDATSQQQGQSQQGQQAQPAQPNPPAQVAPGSESKSESRTDYRSDTTSERVLQPERGKIPGVAPAVAMIGGPVLCIGLDQALVAR